MTQAETDRIWGGRDGGPVPHSIFDINPADVCPGCNLLRAKNGTCACQL